MILVFGGGGQLGCELEQFAARRCVPLTSIPRTVADITDPASVRRQIETWKPTLIVNAAAYTAVDRAETERKQAAKCNEIGAAVVASACTEARIALVHISTNYVFDGRKAGPYVETDPISPLGVYGRTKADGEAAVAAANTCHIILRTSWLYGAFGRNFAKTILKLADERVELRVVSDQFGSPTSARSLAAAILHVSRIIAAETNFTGIYHFAGAGVASWHGFASAIVDAQATLTGRRPDVVAIRSTDGPGTAKRPRNSTLDCGKFESVFGMRMLPWEQEMRDIVRQMVAVRRYEASGLV